MNNERFTENSVSVSVNEFENKDGSIDFVSSEVNVPFPGFGANNIVRTNKMNLMFDFRNLGFTANFITFEFRDTDPGYKGNISVNGERIIVEEFKDLPNIIAQNVTLTMNTTPILGGVIGKVTLTGPVETLLVGGLEFWLDNVCAFEEPPALESPDFPVLFLLIIIPVAIVVLVFIVRRVRRGSS